MSGFANSMTNSTGGLSNLWCAQCQAEVLHRGFTCNHCGATHRAYPVKDLAGKWVSSGMTIVRRKKWNGASR
jgi:hypothetical protein